MDFLVKRGRGLDPAVLGWLMGTLGVGPGIGEVHFLVKAASAYYSWLRDDMRVNPSLIHYTLAEGEDALTASRNDCLLVYPGAYDETAELAWDKANTHLIGLGGPNVGGDWAEPNVVLYSDETDVATIINVTGANSQFHNFVVSNYGNNAACRSALILNKYGCRFKSVAFQGNMLAAQNNVATCSLQINGAGMYPIFEDCYIGQDVWGARAIANSGVIRFGSTGQPNGGIFKRCRIISIGTTATCAMVAIPVAGHLGRGWVFDDCLFGHFDSAGANETINQVFYTVTGMHNHAIELKNCSSFGAAEWQAGNFGVVFATMPDVQATGGIGAEADL